MTPDVLFWPLYACIGVHICTLTQTHTHMITYNMHTHKMGMKEGRERGTKGGRKGRMKGGKGEREGKGSSKEETTVEKRRFIQVWEECQVFTEGLQSFIHQGSSVFNFI